MKKAVIVANGNYPRHKKPLSAINSASYIVCCDGAANDFIARGKIPDAIVGDCDSISEENQILFANLLHPYKEQENNDLTKSVKFCIEQGFTEITIVAATGRREDHTLGNISLLADYEKLIKVKMITDYGTFTPISQTTIFESFPEQKVSIFAISQKPITISGLQYTVENKIFTNLWQGTLNKSIADKFKIETSGSVLVFQVHEDI